MKLKSKKGYAIELMVVFMLVTFAFCTLITVYVASISAQRKNAKREIDSQTVLNQIGEYYLRSVDAGGVFPSNGNNITYSSEYAWMDDNGDKQLTDADATVKFFKKYTNYSYADKMSITYGGQEKFYLEESMWRRLIVSSGGTNKMILTVKEKFETNNKSNCEILTWYIGNGLTSDSDSEFEQTNLTKLQLLWKFFSQTLKKFQDSELDKDSSKEDKLAFITERTEALKKLLNGSN